MFHCLWKWRDVSAAGFPGSAGAAGSSDRPSGRGRRSELLPLLEAAGPPDLLRMLEDGLGELAEDPLHVVLTAGKQTLQEGDVTAVGRQQQGDIRQVLDDSQWEGWVGGTKQQSQ